MKKALAALLCTLGAAAVLYAGFAAWLRIDGRFPFHTSINGHDVSLRRALDVQDLCMDGYYPNMRFRIEGRNGASYSVTPASFDFSGAERAVSFLPENTLRWAETLFEDTDYTTQDGGAIGKLARHIEQDAPLFRDGIRRAPRDAYVAYDDSSGGFQIVPEDDGADIDAQKFEAALKQHILRGQGTLDLDAAGVYRAAAVPSSSPALEDLCARLNRFLDAGVTFTSNGVTLTFDTHRLLPYLYLDGLGQIVYDARAAAESGVFDSFADELGEAFGSTGGERIFLTHDGVSIPVPEKTWRARLDRAATADALAALTFDELSADVPPEGSLVWERAALDHLSNYVEVDLTNQTLYLYTDGKLVLESPLVSGNVAQRHTTPAGAFTLTGKYRNVTLRGPGYASFVRYWMPFNNRIGLHDASWRSTFGGTIYRTNGSHGCVNLPSDVAETVFNTIDESYAIVCYWRPVEEEAPASAAQEAVPAVPAAAAGDPNVPAAA